MSSKLPVTVKMQLDETSLSYVSRLAVANGFDSLVEFCWFMGVSELGIESMDTETAELVSDLSGIPMAELRRFSIPSGKVVAFGATSVKKNQLHKDGLRYCPNCFRDDALTFGGRENTRRYARASWRLRAVENCPVHNTRLLTHQSDDLDYTTFLQYAPELVETSANENSVDECGNYFADRVLNSTPKSFLDTFPYYVAEEFSTVLGRMKMKYLGMEDTATRKSFRNEKFDFPARVLGFEIARHGRGKIEAFLSEMVDAGFEKNIPKPSSLYSIATNWLIPKLDNPDYLTVSTLVQEHAENHIPLAPGEKLLFKVTEQHVHNLKTAEAEYGISQDRIRLILQEHQSELGNEVTFGARMYRFRRDVTHNLFLAEMATISTSRAREMLGCNEATFNRLINKKHISFVANNPNSERVFRRIPRKEVLSLVALMKNKVTLSAVDSGLVSIVKISGGTQSTIADIVDLLLEGRLSRVACPSENPKLMDFHVDPMEIKDAKEKRHAIISKTGTNKKNEHDEILSLERIPERLGANKDSHAALIAAGYIKTISKFNWKTNRDQTYVTQKELDAFKEKYISLNLIAGGQGRRLTHVRRFLEDKGIFPITPYKLGMTIFYDRVKIRSIDLI